MPRKTEETPEVVAPPAPDYRALIDAALAEIEADTASQWSNEQFNAGARAAAAVIRKHLAGA